MSMTFDQDSIEAAVLQKIAECKPFYTPSDFVVSPYDAQGRVIAGPDHIYRIQLRDIAMTLGIELFNKLPPQDLFAFAVRAAERNESTGELLHILITDFLKAYGLPGLSDQVISTVAYLHFLADSPVVSSN